MPPERSPEQTEKMARDAVEEARTVLPGIQTLFGFQLIATFNERFRQLPDSQQLLHFAAIVLITISIALIMTPAAYHRQAEQGTVSDFFVRLASWLIMAAMVPLMLALCLEVYLIAKLIVGNEAVSLATAIALLVVFGTLWFVFPNVLKRRRRRPE